jgi:hypothetical protein
VSCASTPSTWISWTAQSLEYVCLWDRGAKTLENVSGLLSSCQWRSHSSPHFLKQFHELTDLWNLISSYSQIGPSGHLSLTVICVMRPFICCPSAVHFLLKQSVLHGHLSYTDTNFWSPGWPLRTDLTVHYFYHIVRSENFTKTFKCR